MVIILLQITRKVTRKTKSVMNIIDFPIIHYFTSIK